MISLKRQTKITIAVIAAIFVALSTITYYSMTYGPPVPIIENPEDIQSLRVELGGQDVTHAVNRDEVIRLILEYKCRRMPAGNHNFLMDEKAYIHLVYQDKPLHLFFGSVNICYESGNRGWKEIIDAEALLAELEAMVNLR